MLTTEGEAGLLHVATATAGRRSMVEILRAAFRSFSICLRIHPGRQVHSTHVNVHRRSIVRIALHLLRLVACLHGNNINNRNNHLSILTAIFPGGPGLADTRMLPVWILLELRMVEMVSGDNWCYKMGKSPVKSSPPTNQHPMIYRPDALPVAQPTTSEH